jgi:hypothetical protein
MLSSDGYTEGELVFLFSNVMVLKGLHERGYDVADIDPREPVLYPCLEKIFSGRVKWEDIPPPYDEDFAASLGKDTEERAVYEDIMNRDHYKIYLPLDGLAELWPLSEQEFELLAEKMNGLIFPIEETVEELYSPLWAFYRWEYALSEYGTCIGVNLYIYDVPQYSEEFPESREVLGILEVLDLLREVKVRRGKRDDQHTRESDSLAGGGNGTAAAA